MKNILMCTGEENMFGQENNMFALEEQTNFNVIHTKMFLEQGKMHRILRNFGRYFVKNELYYIWHKSLEKIDTLILFDSVVKNAVVSYIRKKNPKLRIIIYFRNQFSTVKKRNINLKFLKKLNCEFWSYHKEDCNNHLFFYNNQFWNKKFLVSVASENVEYDGVFNGRVKNREKEIVKIHDIFEDKNLSSYFYLYPTSDYSFDKNKNNEFLDYVSYLNLVSKSKSIIDLVGTANYGLTLRPLEALFLKKKLITNYLEIDQYDFYNKNNIFILGKDSIEQLNEFLNTDFEKPKEEIIVQYDYEEWLKHFFNR